MPVHPPRRNDLIYPELSYQVIGVLFSTFNELGYRYQEKYYQRAIHDEFIRLGIPFQEFIRVPIKFRDKIIGHYILDFLVGGKIILEIKRGDSFSRQDFTQANAYLQSTGLRLAILARFSSRGLKFKRVVNIQGK